MRAADMRIGTQMNSDLISAECLLPECGWRMTFSFGAQRLSTITEVCEQHPCTKPSERAKVNTELLYAPDEHRVARDLYAQDHPDGPGWAEADLHIRGRYLEKGGHRRLREMFGPPE